MKTALRDRARRPTGPRPSTTTVVELDARMARPGLQVHPLHRGKAFIARTDGGLDTRRDAATWKAPSDDGMSKDFSGRGSRESSARLYTSLAEYPGPNTSRVTRLTAAVDIARRLPRQSTRGCEAPAHSTERDPRCPGGADVDPRVAHEPAVRERSPVPRARRCWTRRDFRLPQGREVAADDVGESGPRAPSPPSIGGSSHGCW